MILKVPSNLKYSVILWFLVMENKSYQLVCWIFPCSLKNHLKPKQKTLFQEIYFSLSLLTFPQLCAILQLQDTSAQIIQVHLKERNQDHTDEIMSSGEVYFDDNVEFHWENHQTWLKWWQLIAATSLNIQWQSCAFCMQSDFSGLSCWTAAHLCQGSRFCLTFTNLLDISLRFFF